MSKELHQVLLLLGSNQGNLKALLHRAICEISLTIGEIVTISSVFFSKSWGYDDNNYANQVVLLRSSLSPMEILKHTQKIEKQLGRTKKTTTHYTARPIDIDILFYDNEIIENATLTIPHPRLHLRNFTLVPLCEIAPKWIHPILKKDVQTLLKTSTDLGEVWKDSCEQK